MRDMSGRRLRSIPVTSAPARSSTRVADRKGNGMDAREDRAGPNTLGANDGAVTAGREDPQSLVDPPAAGRAGGPLPISMTPCTESPWQMMRSVSSPQRRVPRRSIDEATTRR
jgi:hypothetical protein